MKTRISREQALMEMAVSASKRSTCRRKQVGALIAIDGRPLSVGYAGAPSGMPHCLEHGCLIGPEGGCIRTVHAEANAIAFAARKGLATENATLYATVSPCPACAKLIINAGIMQVRYLEEYRLVEGIEILKSAGIRVEQHYYEIEL